MAVWAHTLFKNDERWLWYAVNSVINYVDKLLLWDTESTDRSFEIAKILKGQYPQKIDLFQYGEVTSQTFSKARQAMLEKTESDWFLVLDADEIWWEESIKKLTDFIRENKNEKIESIVVPTINAVGDIYHYQEKYAGRYRFGNLVGHYNLRAIKRSITGLHSQGEHGVWGWADLDDKQIQERNTFKFLDTPYLHTTFLERGQSREEDRKVPKRIGKLKYEMGEGFPLDFYYPESMFKEKPDFVLSPWKTMDLKFEAISFFETPLRKIKRRISNGPVGY